MPELQPIRYFDPDADTVREEDVYGGVWVRRLYGTRIGRWTSALVALPPLSRLYGWLQDRPASASKVAPFVEQFGIEMADFLPQAGQPAGQPYATFNDFFTRRVTDAARPFAQGASFPAPCDARYFGYDQLDASVQVPVKGSLFEAAALISSERWNQVFAGGPAFIARLCPVDYHRFHYPDDGHVLATWRIPGALHSVNPWALAFRGDIFMINERQVTILQTEQFGKLAWVEVGATCVGKIRQTHTTQDFVRGEEKGMFLFGGSTVIVLGEPGRWQIDPDIVRRTGEGVETYLKMGRALGTSFTGGASTLDGGKTVP